MHVALLGSTGFVGKEFARQVLQRGYQLTAIRRATCDIYCPQTLASVIKEHSADVLINCAGYTGVPNVDACENDKARCLQANAVLPGLIAEACADAGIPWGHVSSGCIFQGKRRDGNGFTESDPPNFSFRNGNCSWYSGTKAMGEEILRDRPDCYIWRLRMPFSNLDSRRNYLSKVLRYERLLEVENSLSNLHEYVSAALDCVARTLPFGTYHLTNPGSIRTSDICELMHDVGLTQKRFEFFESESDFMHSAAKTPRSSCVLDSSKAIDAGLKLTPVHESIRRSLEQWQETD